MNKQIYRITILITLMAGHMCAKDTTNELQKIFYHQGNDNKEKSNQLEVGKVVFYFAKAPIINTLTAPQTDAAMTEYAFFFPMTSIKSAECKKAFTTINTDKTDGKKPYSVKLEIADKPIKGIKMVVAYNSKQVTHAIESFDAINMSKGIVVRFYNKTLINAIKDKGDEVLRVAYAGKKKEIIIDCGHGGAL